MSVGWKSSSGWLTSAAMKRHRRACSGSRTARLTVHLAGGHALGPALESASSDRTHSPNKDTGSAFLPAAQTLHHRRHRSWET